MHDFSLSRFRNSVFHLLSMQCNRVHFYRTQVQNITQVKPAAKKNAPKVKQQSALHLRLAALHSARLLITQTCALADSVIHIYIPDSVENFFRNPVRSGSGS